jgi:hypothetical protein
MLDPTSRSRRKFATSSCRPNGSSVTLKAGPEPCRRTVCPALGKATPFPNNHSSITEQNISVAGNWRERTHDGPKGKGMKKRIKRDGAFIYL